mmetsp:Transcript_6011/g.17106  ORF Transcript_6011/g.17106 Transcript_6011/m.17106 type:complete len:97 (+) Transcript_6011:2687-2977(+)
MHNSFVSIARSRWLCRWCMHVGHPRRQVSNKNRFRLYNAVFEWFLHTLSRTITHLVLLSRVQETPEFKRKPDLYECLSPDQRGFKIQGVSTDPSAV